MKHTDPPGRSGVDPAQHVAVRGVAAQALVRDSATYRVAGPIARPLSKAAAGGAVT